MLTEQRLGDSLLIAFLSAGRQDIQVLGTLPVVLGPPAFSTIIASNFSIADPAYVLSQTRNGVEKLDFSQTPKNPPREDALHAPFGTSVSPRHPPFRLSMVKQGVFQHH